MNDRWCWLCNARPERCICHKFRQMIEEFRDAVYKRQMHSREAVLAELRLDDVLRRYAGLLRRKEQN